MIHWTALILFVAALGFYQLCSVLHEICKRAYRDEEWEDQKLLGVMFATILFSFAMLLTFLLTQPYLTFARTIHGLEIRWGNHETAE